MFQMVFAPVPLLHLLDVLLGLMAHSIFLSHEFCGPWYLPFVDSSLLQNKCLTTLHSTPLLVYFQIENEKGVDILVSILLNYCVFMEMLVLSYFLQFVLVPANLQEVPF